jgi:hypothetical protein
MTYGNCHLLPGILPVSRYLFLAWRSAAGEAKEMQRAVLRAWRKAVEARHVHELACRMADTYNVYRLQRMVGLDVCCSQQTLLLVATPCLHLFWTYLTTLLMAVLW